MQMISNFQSSILWGRTTFSESLVKIRRHDVTWRHVTSFLKIVLKKCWRQQKISTMGKLFIIFRLHLDNIFPSRGQPTFYNFWFALHRHQKSKLSKTKNYAPRNTSSNARNTNKLDWNGFGSPDSLPGNHMKLAIMAPGAIFEVLPRAKNSKLCLDITYIHKLYLMMPEALRNQT